MCIMTEHKERIKQERKSFKVNFIINLIDDLDEEQTKLFKQIYENARKEK